jgi:hypothetical protein
VHDDVRDTGQGQARDQRAAVAVEHDERTAVGRAEQPVGVEPEAVRAFARDSQARSIAARSQTITTICAGVWMLA